MEAAKNVLSVLKVPSSGLYLVLLVVMIHYRKELQSTFFDISISMGVADLLAMTVSTIHITLMTYSGILQWSADSRLIYSYIKSCFWNGSFLAQMGGALVLTINRFTALTLGKQHGYIWSGTSTLLAAICLQWAASVIYVGALLGGFAGFNIVATNQTPMGYTTTPAVVGYIMFHDVLISIAVVGLYVCMVVKAVLHRKNVSSKIGSEATADERLKLQKQKEEKVVEHRLTIIGLVLGACVVYAAVFDVTYFVSTHSETPDWVKAKLWPATIFMYQNISPFAGFIFIFSNPYLLLMFSTQLRMRFRKCFR